MNVRSAVLVAVSLILLQAVDAGAASTDWCQSMPSERPQALQRGQDNGRRDGKDAGRDCRVMDEATGAWLGVTRFESGTVEFGVRAGDLEVSHVRHLNGDFEMAFKGSGDKLALTRRGQSLVVSRSGQAIALDMTSPGVDDLVRVQELVAGSGAARQFRALRGMLSARTSRSWIGAGAAILDAFVSVLKGEAPPAQPVVGPPADSSMAMMAMESELDGPGCYESWVGSVVVSWGDYSNCVYSFAWYNPLRLVCAFEWVLRVESAWFQFLGCSSIPIKKDAFDAEYLGRHH